MIRARSTLEALLWAEFDPCACGADGTGWEVARLDPPPVEPGVAEVDLEGTCANCGRVRTTTFDVPWPPDAPTDHFAAADAAPSELLDAALWWAVARQHADAADRLLGGAPPGAWSDRDRWNEVVSLLTRSLAALDETLRFVPPDASSVPADAFWLPHTRELANQQPEIFARSALVNERAESRLRLAEFVARHPAPPAVDDPDGRPSDPEESDRPVPRPLVRSLVEADLYLSLHSCACGSADIPDRFGYGDEDGVPVYRYTGTCPRCGALREFVFRAPDEPGEPTDGGWATGPEPSELLDPGEWLHVVDTLLGHYPAPADLAPGERESLQSDLVACAAAVDEALKFLPPGAATIPESAFRSERGRAMWRAEPGRFSRLRLEALREAYLHAIADLNR